MNTPPSTKEIFSEAVERPPGERAAYLDRACTGRPDLRTRVEELLAVHDGAGEFLAAPTNVSAYVPTDTASSAGAEQEGPGTVIGRYRILQTIGEGGFGTVYMAEQQEPVRRKVALKIIKLGMDTKQVIARFEAERQALAMMDHPNIAKVFDAGATATGRPYFVMELVKGVPLGEYCDTESLSTSERLGLFVQVCRAVQHAHQKGIIHRDIKPSNVMVTLHDGLPVPKVIDFGIAKATNARLTEKTLFTEYRQLIGTPEYMSPEQAEMSGLDVDTRSDIYSLGVLLYELLTGTTPFDSKALRRAGYGEIQRIIREEEPPKPSTRLSLMATAQQRATGASGGNGEDHIDSTSSLSAIARNRHTDPSSLAKSLRGDLDWIVMKAMEKDRNRRYETANDLARDIGRHLDDEPVMASPPSAGYRLRKVIRRNRGTFVAASLVFVVLVLGILGTSMGMVRAVRAERLAQKQTSIVEAVNDFLNRDLLAAVGPTAAGGRGEVVLMRHALDTAAQRIEEASLPGGRFADKPLVEASIRGTISETYRLLGEFGEAETHARRAAEICWRVLGDEHPTTLRAKRGLATVFYGGGQLAEAESLNLDALEIEMRILGEEHPDTLDSMSDLAAVYCSQGRFGDAEPLIVKAVEIRMRTQGEDHPQTRRSVGTLVKVYCSQGRFAEAEPLLVDEQEIKNLVVFSDGLQTLGSLQGWAALYLNEGRFAEAEALYGQALEIGIGVLGEEHPESIQVLNDFARLQLIRKPPDLRDPKAALSMARKANQLTNHENPYYVATLALAWHVNGDTKQAINLQRKALILLGEGEFNVRARMEARLAEFEATLDDVRG